MREYEVQGWIVDLKQVRRFASKVGIPSDVPIPEVIIVGEEEDKFFQECPQIQADSSGQSPSGYFITVPGSMLEREDITDYVLGPRTVQNIKHELAHYIEYLKPGASIGKDNDPYVQAIKEIRADLRGGVSNLSWALSRQAVILEEDYGLPDREAFELVSKAASSLGVSKYVIGRARNLYRRRRN